MLESFWSFFPYIILPSSFSSVTCLCYEFFLHKVADCGPRPRCRHSWYGSELSYFPTNLPNPENSRKISTTIPFSEILRPPPSPRELILQEQRPARSLASGSALALSPTAGSRHSTPAAVMQLLHSVPSFPQPHPEGPVHPSVCSLPWPGPPHFGP